MSGLPPEQRVPAADAVVSAFLLVHVVLVVEGVLCAFLLRDLPLLGGQLLLELFLARDTRLHLSNYKNPETNRKSPVSVECSPPSSEEF